jgi:hypothetical protein
VQIGKEELQYLKDPTDTTENPLRSDLKKTFGK